MSEKREGYQFVGWYENDKLISQETQYRFCVEKDTLLVAKFEKDGESANPENTAYSLKRSHPADRRPIAEYSPPATCMHVGTTEW